MGTIPTPPPPLSQSTHSTTVYVCRPRRNRGIVLVVTTHCVAFPFLPSVCQPASLCFVSLCLPSPSFLPLPLCVLLPLKSLMASLSIPDVNEDAHRLPIPPPEPVVVSIAAGTWRTWRTTGPLSSSWQYVQT